MEMTMNSRHSLPTSHGMAAASRYWMSEFERIHVMTAARLRGKRLRFRRATP
jgi:hypothetical protein